MLHFGIPSSVDGHLCHSQVLGILNNAAMNIDVIFLCGYVFLYVWDIYLRAELLGHMVPTYQNF